MKHTSILSGCFVLLAACGSQSVHQAAPARRPSFVESVTPLPDGTKEIVVSGKFSPAPSGGQVQSANLRDRLEQAAKAECGEAVYEVTPSNSIGNASSGSSGLKFTLKGIVRCASSK